MKILAQRAEQVTPSPTLAISAKAKKMKKSGINVIGFGAGEPDFDTPSAIKEAAVKSIENGFTKYTPASGIDELKEAVTAKFKKDNNLDYDKGQVIIGCGAKHILYNIFQVICNPGDEIILPNPYWVSYSEMIKLAGGQPIFVTTLEEEGFVPQPEKIAAAITSKTKAIVINSPNNPTGSVYPEKVLKEIAAIAVERNILVISDEVYERLIYGNNRHVSLASFGDDIKANTIVVNAVSKTYAMTGWRIGYAAGPKDITSAMAKIQSHSTSNPASISQKAALKAISGDQSEVAKMVTEFAKRRDYVIDRCKKIPGLTFSDPQGAFYIFPNISSYFGKKLSGTLINNSMEFASHLLEKSQVALVPGSAFGDDRYVRITFANALNEIADGFNRLEDFLKQ